MESLPRKKPIDRRKHMNPWYRHVYRESPTAVQWCPKIKHPTHWPSDPNDFFKWQQWRGFTLREDWNPTVLCFEALQVLHQMELHGMPLEIINKIWDYTRPSTICDRFDIVNIFKAAKKKYNFLHLEKPTPSLIWETFDEQCMMAQRQTRSIILIKVDADRFFTHTICEECGMYHKRTKPKDVKKIDLWIWNPETQQWQMNLKGE
jgi:hypothetical protein